MYSSYVSFGSESHIVRVYAKMSLPSDSLILLLSPSFMIGIAKITPLLAKIIKLEDLRHGNCCLLIFALLIITC